VAVAFPCGQSRVFQHTRRYKTPLCPPHSQKWLMPYLASGSRTLKKGHRYLFGIMKIKDKRKEKNKKGQLVIVF